MTVRWGPGRGGSKRPQVAIACDVQTNSQLAGGLGMVEGGIWIYGPVQNKINYPSILRLACRIFLIIGHCIGVRVFFPGVVVSSEIWLCVCW